MKKRFLTLFLTIVLLTTGITILAENDTGISEDNGNEISVGVTRVDPEILANINPAVLEDTNTNFLVDIDHVIVKNIDPLVLACLVAVFTDDKGVAHTIYDLSRLPADAFDTENGVQKSIFAFNKKALDTLKSVINSPSSDLQINNVTDLLNFATQVNAGNTYEGQTITLNSDIDLENVSWTPIGTEESFFAGSFDGQGYKISNLTINAPNSDYQGFFGYTARLTEIKNIKFIDCDITGNDYVGILSGFSCNTFKNCTATGIVSGNTYVGGLVGYIEEGSIYDSYSECAVNGVSEIGGLVGYCGASTMINCYATGDVTATGNNVGGLIGLSSVYEMENCCATGDVGGADNVGGLVGSCEQTIFSQSFAMGNVEGADNVGGFVGEAKSVRIESCYSRGAVSGNDNIGAFAGYFVRDYGVAYIRDSYATGSSSSDELFGYIEQDILAFCTYEDSIEMQTANANQGIALNLNEKIWLNDSSINNGYPVFDYQISGFSSVPELTLTSTEINSVGEKIPLTDKSIYDGVEASVYLYYNNHFSPAIFREGKTIKVDSEIKVNSGTKKFMLSFAVYKEKKLIMLKTANDITATNSSNLSITIPPHELPQFENIEDYYAKVLVWETDNLKPVVESERLNGMHSVDGCYNLSSNTQTTQNYGLINFIPQSDGYYDIRTTGENVEIGGVLYHQDPLYNTNENLIGQELLRVPSTAGVSIHNKGTYELKAGKEYSLKLENMSGSGDYDVAIEKIETMQDIYVKHNEPVIPTSGGQKIFTPIKWVGDEVVETTENDSDWYDYRVSQNKWANIMLQEGSMFVWIPRYAYRLVKDSNPDVNVYSNQIEVKYLNGLTNIAYDGTVCKTVDQNPNSTDFIVHPGFTHGGVTYSGLWIAKFQASANDGSVSIGDVTSGVPHFAPDKAIWRGNRMDRILTVKDKLNASGNPYGLPTDKNIADAHLLKSSEWGAVAYLAYSTAWNTGAAKNVSEEYLTGGGDYINNTEQSTSRNAYGIYDMSGAAYEFVAAYKTTHNPSRVGNIVNTNILAAKYVDSIEIGFNDIGHALSETKQWTDDQATDMDSDYPVLNRGYYGTGTSTTNAGLFSYNRSSVSADSSKSWRASIWVPGTSTSTLVPQTITTNKQYSSVTLDNPYTGRMVFAGIISTNDRYNDYVQWGNETLEPSMINVDLFWDKIMPNGSITVDNNGKIKVTGEIDVDYINGTAAQLRSHSPRLASWRNKNVRAIMRLILEEPSQGEEGNPYDDGDDYEIPAWLIQQVGFNNLYREFAYDGYYDENLKKTVYRKRAYQPNYSNEMLIAAHEYTIKKLAEVYNNDPFIAFVQIGSIGRWGEWNEESNAVYIDGNGAPDPNTSVSVPNAEIADRYVRPYVRNYTKKQLSMRYPHPLGKKYFTGLHDDTVASNKGFNEFLARANDTRRVAGEIQPQKQYFWQNNFMHGETSSRRSGDAYGDEVSGNDKWVWYSSLPTHSSDVNTYKLESGTTYINSTLKQLEKLHISFYKFSVRNSETPPARRTSVAANLKSAMNKIGARLWVSRVDSNATYTKGTTQDITLTWKNDGIAPFNFDWDVEVSLLDSSGNVVTVNGNPVKAITNPLISKCMPTLTNQHTVSLEIPANLQNGSYKLAVAVLSPYTNEPELELANNEQNYNKRYVMQNISVN